MTTLLAMRRLLVLVMLCLLPLQISWAAAANYWEHGEHEQDKTAQHFGHHGEHTVSSDSPDDGAQAGKSSLGHDHCHLSSFLGILSAFHIPARDFSRPSPHCDNCFPPSLAPDKPERPKWSAPA
ncbi:MAG: hypothetical protein AMXMBFR52_22590 [Burkholderiales bacterium]